MREHREVERIVKGRTFTRVPRKQSETSGWKSIITDHACQFNHMIDWVSARLVEKETDWTAGGRGMK